MHGKDYLRKIALTTAALVAMGTAATASTMLDFNTFNGGVPSTPGNITGTEYTDFGVTITAMPNTPGVPLGLFNSNCGVDFDSSCTTVGTDSDLATGPSFNSPPQGRVLILNGGTDAAPNDSAAGGSFLFTFSRPTLVESVNMLDLDEANAEDKVAFTFGYTNGSFETVTGLSGILLNPPFAGDNSLRLFGFDRSNVATLKVTLDGISGAINLVTYTPVPVPAGLPLVATGLVLLGLLRRRKTA